MGVQAPAPPTGTLGLGAGLTKIRPGLMVMEDGEHPTQGATTTSPGLGRAEEIGKVPIGRAVNGTPVGTIRRARL